VPSELPLVVELPLADGQDVDPQLFADLVFLVFILGLESEFLEGVLDLSEFLELIVLLAILALILFLLLLFGLLAGLFLVALHGLLPVLLSLLLFLVLLVAIVIALIGRDVPNMAKALASLAFWGSCTSYYSSSISFWASICRFFYSSCLTLRRLIIIDINKKRIKLTNSKIISQDFP
jgi:hypothetical protein